MYPLNQKVLGEYGLLLYSIISRFEGTGMATLIPFQPSVSGDDKPLRKKPTIVAPGGQPRSCICSQELLDGSFIPFLIELGPQMASATLQGRFQANGSARVTVKTWISLMFILTAVQTAAAVTPVSRVLLL